MRPADASMTAIAPRRYSYSKTIFLFPPVGFLSGWALPLLAAPPRDHVRDHVSRDHDEHCRPREQSHEREQRAN